LSFAVQFLSPHFSGRSAGHQLRPEQVTELCTSFSSEIENLINAMTESSGAKEKIGGSAFAFHFGSVTAQLFD
jgi:hypothetical protein